MHESQHVYGDAVLAISRRGQSIFSPLCAEINYGLAF